jgi:dTDP-4-amino-4,6-dideoxy-D-galactose acyltransferase
MGVTAVVSHNCWYHERSVPAEILEWDTAFFGFRIARVTPESAGEIDAWCASEGVRCLYLLCRVEDAETIRTAEDHGYRLVDVRMTLRQQPGVKVDAAGPARPARSEDLLALQAISRECYHDTRFYNDPGFPRPLVTSLYETWIRRSVEGWADAVLVTEDHAGPTGYITCHQQGWRIGLVGVASRARGEGVGRTLVTRALEWFRAEGAPEVAVSTQGRNTAALRLYQRCGFLLEAVELWYHKWYRL